MTTPLPQTFFARETITVARELVGCELRVFGCDDQVVSGRIVEVEAYEGENDPASHAGRGRTPRSEIMFGPAGFIYVYLIYGMYHCLNIVTAEEGTSGAVLIRAVEPVSGRRIMASRRGLNPETSPDRNLCAGPGRLCQALAIDLAWNGLSIGNRESGKTGEFPGEIQVVAGEAPSGGIVATPRIGIRKAVTRPLRFIDPTSKYLSS
jgi:DNA-3-methyladenine glycosylase